MFVIATGVINYFAGDPTKCRAKLARFDALFQIADKIVEKVRKARQNQTRKNIVHELGDCNLCAIKKTKRIDFSADTERGEHH